MPLEWRTDMRLTIEIYDPDFDGFSVKANGTTLMEYLGSVAVEAISNNVNRRCTCE